MNHHQLFCRLFYTYRTSVYNQVFYMTGSSWHAEEIVQDVFLKVWTHRNKLESIVDIKAWLFTTTKRRVLDYIFKHSREQLLIASFEQSANSVEINDVLLSFNCRKLLNEATALLPPRQQEAFYLKVMKGYGKKEIARLLNISEFTALIHIKKSTSTVRNHLLEKLELHYQPQFPP